MLMAVCVPVLGVAGGCWAGGLVRRSGRAARGWGRLVLLIGLSLLVVGIAAWSTARADVWWQGAVLTLAGVAVPLSVLDLAEQRIPSRILNPAFVLTLALLSLDAAVTHHAGALMRAVLAAAVLYAGALALLLAADDSLGYGDVKALAYQGLYTGYLSWGRVLGALLLAFTAAAVAALVLNRLSRRARTLRISFAPYILAAALFTVLFR